MQKIFITLQVDLREQYKKQRQFMTPLTSLCKYTIWIVWSVILSYICNGVVFLSNMYSLNVLKESLMGQD